MLSVISCYMMWSLLTQIFMSVKVATIFCSWIVNDVAVSCLLKNSATSACISKSQIKTLQQCFPKEILNLLTKHKLLTDELVKVRWDKNESIGGNLDEKRRSKKQGGGGNVFWGKLILLIQQQIYESNFSPGLEAKPAAAASFILRASGAFGPAVNIPKSCTYLPIPEI